MGGFYAVHFNIPSVIGVLAGVGLIAGVCSFTGKRIAKLSRAKS